MIIDQLFTRPIFEAADPNRLIATISITDPEEGQSVKEVDLTGKFQGDVKSQMSQAADYLTKFLEARGFNFSNIQLRYQGKIMNTQNLGAMSPQSDWEREADAKAAQMRTQRQASAPAVKEDAAMASPEQLAYNKLRAQWDSYQTMTGGGGTTAVSRDPAHAAKLATIPAEIARMAAALKAKGIDAEAQYDALSGPAAAPVDANQAYGSISENKSDPITQFASNAHEEWRRNFDPTGTKPRIKKNSDGTEGDINVPFADLHPDWQKENLAAGRAAQHAVKHFGRDMEKAAEFIHRQWMKRNPKGDWNAAQHVPYDDLSDDEKEKDRVHVRTMMRLMGHQTNESGLQKFSHKKNRFKSLHKLQNPLGEEGTGGSEGSLNEFAPGGEDGNSPYAYGMAILGYAEDYKQIHRKSSSTDDDVADIIEIGNTFLNKGMAAGIAALFSVDTFVSDSIVDDLAEQGFNVMADLIDKRPRSAQWHQQMAAGQQALADYEANRKKSSEETDGSKAVDTLARVLKSSLKDYQAADGDKNKLKQLGLLIGLSDNHRSAIHHALQQIQQNDFDGAIKSLVATPPGASGPGYDALDYGYSKQKAGVSVQQLIQFIRKHFELSEQGVAEGGFPKKISQKEVDKFQKKHNDKLTGREVNRQEQEKKPADNNKKQGVAEGTGSSIERILAAHPEAVENFKQGGDLDYDLESDLWEYYFNNGEIRNYDADASEFISQRLADELGLSEGLDANQKRVGQLGPTEKVKNNNIGKLVGANENFINTVDQAVVSEEDEMAESILSAIKKAGKKVLDKVAPGDEELLKQLDKDAHGGKLPNRYNSDAESAKKYPADSWKVKVDESSDELARILTIMNHRR